MRNNLKALVSLLLVLLTSVAYAQKSEETSKKWRISLNGGIGYRLASTKENKKALINQGYDPGKVDDYFKEIKWGTKASAQFHYLWDENWGIGLDYQHHHSSGKITGNIDPQDGVTMYYGQTEDKVFTNYLGLSYYFAGEINEKLLFYGQTSVGIAYFRQETVSLYSPILITGNTLGTNLELGLEYLVYENIGLAFSVNYFQAKISKVELDNGNSTADMKLEGDQKEGLARLDAGVGIRYYF
ncbi:hypothetical protein EYV94_13095 [Puteibacter caeruleilacunae]|nr:hypothetical protein EYV94_13095 [Puteibacter caeruleilacunae]